MDQRELHSRYESVSARCYSSINIGSQSLRCIQVTLGPSSGINYQTGLLSSIRRLPNELLLEVLLYSSGGRVNVCSPRSWKFERVCKRWRDISFFGDLVFYRCLFGEHGSLESRYSNNDGRPFCQTLSSSFTRSFSFRQIRLGRGWFTSQFQRYL